MSENSRSQELERLPTGARPAWSLRLALWMLGRARQGRLAVVMPDGSRHLIEGPEPGPVAEMRVHRAAFVRRVVNNGAVGFGEAYMAGDWDSPDLASVIAFMAVNEHRIQGPYGSNLLGALVRAAGHRLRRNSRSGSRRNIRYHYDLGNDFYRLWLDATMTYSSAVFPHGRATLDEAQRHKYELLLARLQLRPDHHLLEIGSGWGGFALYAARQTGCRVTSITLSPAQHAEACARAQAAGLSDRVEFRVQDYRDLAGQFDRIVSVEMYEAVGRAYWPRFFATLHDRLMPGGRAVVQGITIDANAFANYARSADFVQTYIFPGGMLASPEAFREAAQSADLGVESADWYGADYARTLACWHERFLQVREAVQRQFDERFVRMWRYYLAYCEAGFRIGRIDLMQTTLVRPDSG